MAGQGERWWQWRAPDASVAVQPGGRPPAPAALALVQAFINTHYDLVVEHGAEVLATPREAGSWLARHRLLEPGVAVDEQDRQRLLALREGLRGLARANSDHVPSAEPSFEAVNDALAGAAVELRFTPDGPRCIPSRPGVDGAVGVLAAITAEAMLDGSWSRLKVCPGEHCGWAFYDHSRNQTGRWCSMSVCGGRAKARAHYRRRRRDAR